MEIESEALTHKNFEAVSKIERSDIGEEFVDSADTIIKLQTMVLTTIVLVM